MNTPNHNQFDKCLFTRVFMLIRCDNTVKVLSTFKHASTSPMVERSETLDYLFLAVPGVGSNPAKGIEFHFAFFALLTTRRTHTNEIKHDIHPEY